MLESTNPFNDNSSANRNYGFTNSNEELECNGIPMMEYTTDVAIMKIDDMQQQQQQQQQQQSSPTQQHQQQQSQQNTLSNKKNWPSAIIIECLLHTIVVIYFSYATYFYINEKNDHCPSEKSLCKTMQFCSGYGFLLLLFTFIYLTLIYYRLIKQIYNLYVQKQQQKQQQEHVNYLIICYKQWLIWSKQRILRNFLIVVFIISFAVYLFYETRYATRKLIGLLGPCIFIIIGYIFSLDRHVIPWRTVLNGIIIQFLLGILCIRWDIGRNIFDCIGGKVSTFLSFTEAGSRFVFGNQLINDGIFAFAALSNIFFFSFFISILYYINVMQWLVMKMGWFLQILLNTTVCESVNASANIFLGMTECPLLIRPYIKSLTASELHSIMVSGFATVSGSVLAAYLKFGASAAYLVTSSVMAAPASLALSKLFLPETEESHTKTENIQLEKSEDSSILDAASNGANNAINIVLGIISNLIAFIACIAFLNAIVNWFGVLIGFNDINFEWIFSKLFIPLAWTMGVAWKDCEIVAKVIAKKTIINEFVAYEHLGVYMKNKAISTRSAGIATFAICGFANPSSVGILVGALNAMAPGRRALIASVAFRAFIVGTLVCFTSASFVGLLMEDDDDDGV